MSSPPIPDRARHFLRETAPFNELSDASFETLLHTVAIEYFEKGDAIPSPAKEDEKFLYVVESGTVELREPDSNAIIDKCGTGDCFGSDRILEDPASYVARAASSVICLLIPEDTFRSLYDNHERIRHFFDGKLDGYIGLSSTATRSSEEDHLYGKRLGNLVRRSPVTCPPDTVVRTAAEIMRDEQVGSILVTDGHQLKGIVTDTDIRNRIVARGLPGDVPVREIMSTPVQTLDGSKSLFEGLLLMTSEGIHHVVVTDDSAAPSGLIGVVSDTDIAHSQSYNPASTAKRLKRAQTVEQLRSVWHEYRHHLGQLHHHGIDPEDILSLLTEGTDRLTCRLLHLAIQEVNSSSNGGTMPLRWAWMGLGSEGRREMIFSSDQDNAVIFETPESKAEKEQARQWLSKVANRVNEHLAYCGFERCPGDIMASNPEWCQSLSQWKRDFREWIEVPDRKALMHSCIFFDLRSIYGTSELVESLKSEIRDMLDKEAGFLPFLMHNAEQLAPPLSFFRRFVVERGGEHNNTFDLKRRGIMPITDIARVLALDGRFYESTNTFDRLRYARRHLSGIGQLAENLVDAHRYLVDLRLSHQLEAIRNGETPDNHIQPDTLSKVQQRMLKVVFSSIEAAQNTLSHRYGTYMMRD